MSRAEHSRVQDPGDRFCGQCGERRTVRDSRARGGRCGDCADYPVEVRRFCRTTGALLDPCRRRGGPPLSSYLGPIVEVVTHPGFRGFGTLKVNEPIDE